MRLRSSRRRGIGSFTLLETIAVVVIATILASLGLASFIKWKEKNDRAYAYKKLIAIQRAEWDYMARTQECTEDFKKLNVIDPNSHDSGPYVYSLHCLPEFYAQACLKKSPQVCFKVDIYGNSLAE